MKYLALMAIMSCLLCTSCGANKQEVKTTAKTDLATVAQEKGDKMPKMEIKIKNKSFEATIIQNATTDALIKRLPLDLKMKDLYGNEKYVYFSKGLPSQARNVGKVNVGDIKLYGNDCLVIFYDSFTTPYSYTDIGKIGNVDALQQVVGSGDVSVSLSLVKK